MRIEVIFFASHRDIVGRDEICLSLPQETDVAQAAALLSEEYPGLAPLLRHSRPAVNQEYCALDRKLSEGDNLAFIPPVSGG